MTSPLCPLPDCPPTHYSTQHWIPQVMLYSYYPMQRYMHIIRCNIESRSRRHMHIIRCNIDIIQRQFKVWKTSPHKNNNKPITYTQRWTLIPVEPLVVLLLVLKYWPASTAVNFPIAQPMPESAIITLYASKFSALEAAWFPNAGNNIVE